MILLNAYNLSTTFTIKEFSFRVLHFLICLNPDSPDLYWPCCFQQHAYSRMTAAAKKDDRGTNGHENQPGV